MVMVVNSIGTVKSPISKGIDQDWGSVISEIHLEESLSEGLRGLEEFSDIMIIFFMHESTFDEHSDLVRRPQGREDMPLVGIFSQRAKHRPNPIGVTVVRLLGISGNILTVKGLDAIDNTPVLDIKPYFQEFDCRAQATAPAWVNQLMQGYF